MTVTCWRWSCTEKHPCARCSKMLAEAMAPDHVAWYRDTGHCGGCGQPGVFCLCTERHPCGCRVLHEMGSGLVGDALDQFAVITDANQPELF